MPADVTEWRVEPADWNRAIADCDGPQLVVAGPGTGKTEFLVRRAHYLIEAVEVPPQAVLILAFSRRAAADLRSRVEAALDRSTTGIPASTFHSLAFRLLEAHAPAALGWKAMPSLLTGPEQVALVADLLAAEDPADWPAPFRALLSTTTFAEEVSDFLMRSQEHLLDDDAIRSLSAQRPEWQPLPDFRRRYLEELKSRRRIDYGTLQAQAVRLLDLPAVQTAVGAQYRYVLVDEYQDTTAAQAHLLQRLYAGHRNLSVAADPYQSVYSFRGAELTNVAEFPARFPDAEGRPGRRLVLTTSFRVPAEILAAAERVTSGGSLPGAAGAVLPAPHLGRVDAYVFHQQSQEAEWIASETERLHLEEATPYRHMAVLVRTKRRLLPELSRALERRGIPHDSPDARLADHPAVRLVFDVVWAAGAHATDSAGAAEETDRALRRLLLGPLFAVPLGLERDLLRERRRRHMPWPEILRRELPGGGPLADLLDEGSWASERPAVEGFWHLWTSVPQFEALVADPRRGDYRAAWSSLAQALARQAERDEALALNAYLRLAQQDDFEATPLLSYAATDEDRLTLTTLHQAKGLEFEVVFVADAVEGVFPDLRRARSILQPRLLSRSQSADPGDNARFRLQEEMRLAYTAITRARRSVVWTATQAGIDESERRPSRFLLAVGDVISVGELGVPPGRGDRPVTHMEAEAYLRRILVDPALPHGRRLAAAQVLAARPDQRLRPATSFALVRERGTDTGLLEDDLHLSPSQADAYQTCPRRYAFERRLEVSEPAGLYARFGQLVHQVLEETERSAVDGGRQRGTVDEALACLERLIPDFDFGPDPFREAWRRRAVQLLTGLYQDWLRPDAVPVLLEHSLEMQIDTVLWRGRADRIESPAPGRLRVVDYKTSKSQISKKEAASSLQLGFYLLAARRDPAITAHGAPVEAEFWYPFSTHKQKWVPFETSRLGEVAGQMREVTQAIRAEDWTPRPGKACDRCAVKLVCPAWPDGREAFVR